jgi:CrcB protein
MKELLLVGAGSCIGGMARYLVTLALKNVSSYPLATFTANIVGCFVIGVLWTITNKYSNISNTISLFLMVGFCGGFTTFSSFSKESLSMLLSGHYIPFLLYSLGSVIAGLIAVALGTAIGKL